ncbi:MAG: nuclear transport factor 2 family protein [Acidimicrobiales bacterium]
MSEATDVVDAQTEAYKARDLERFLSQYADDASVVGFDGSPICVDKEAMHELYGRLFADSADLQVTIAKRMAAGEFVVDEEHVTGLRLEGMSTEVTAVAVYRVTGGKIARAMLLF